jgi:hemerythrin-like domain-containing protein
MPTATEVLKKEHQAILKMVEASETVAGRLKQGENVSSETLETFQEFFQIFTDQCHHGKEEDIFYPLLEARGMPKSGGPLGVMFNEHEQGRALVREMRQAAEAYASGAQGSGARWAQAADQYAVLLRSHIQKEDMVLFPMAERLLSGNELERVADDFEKLEVEKMGAGTHERLHAKMHKLLEEVHATK